MGNVRDRRMVIATVSFVNAMNDVVAIFLVVSEGFGTVGDRWRSLVRVPFNQSNRFIFKSEQSIHELTVSLSLGKWRASATNVIRLPRTVDDDRPCVRFLCGKRRCDVDVVVSIIHLDRVLVIHI